MALERLRHIEREFLERGAQDGPLLGILRGRWSRWAVILRALVARIDRAVVVPKGPFLEFRGKGTDKSIQVRRRILEIADRDDARLG